MNYEGPEDSTYLDGAALREAIAAATQGITDSLELRQRFFAPLKAAFTTVRDKVRSDVLEHGLHGLDAARSLSAIQDTIIRIVFEFATTRVYTTPGEAEALAVVATGGYGRGELAPGSDIDLLFLRAAKAPPDSDHVVEFILYVLWDLGLKVGHATRSVTECMRQGKQDITICTALLEARFIGGAHSHYDELRKRFWTEIATGSGREFVEAKLAERDDRHVRQGETRYLVEPNIKEGKGGLRDLQTLYWMGKYLYHVYDAAALVQHNVFSQEEYETFQKAEAFLWNVRVHLHYLMGRAEERISFDAQPGLAAALGFTDENPRQAVENFMRAYFLVAKDVGDLTRIFCAALEFQNRKRREGLTRILPGFLRPRSSSDDFFVDTGRLNAQENTFSKDPVNFIRIFHLADAKEIDIHPHALRAITRQLPLIDDALRANKSANALFLEILSSPRKPDWTLKLMNEAGVLGRFVPEFGRIVALMQFNMYHHYTVDEHLIRAIGYVAAIEHNRFEEEHPIATDIIRRIKSREVLYCAMLLHDIAKGLEGDHSVLGGAIAQTVCARFGLSAEDIASVDWLVKNHLVMSDIAQRRDISDPKTVRDFVSIVQSPEMLRYLLILTVADICAVGPGVWNGWKAQLLRELYYEAEAVMSGGDTVRAHSARVHSAKHMLAEKIADLPEDVRNHNLERHYDSYWLAFDTAMHERHARMMADTDMAQKLFGFEAIPNKVRAVMEIAIYAPDHPGVFARISGAIAVAGGSIVDAKAFTTSDGFALDVFSVLDAEGGPFDDEARLSRLRQTIEKTIAGEIFPRTLIAQRTTRGRNKAFTVPARVNFDNDASTTATVIEVRGPDRLGFLNDVASALFHAGLSISSAMIATYGERVVDVFYVRDAFGHKITHLDKLKAVEASLLIAVEGKKDKAKRAAHT
ncbi:MAG: [protein-PII] uridylyltransferase [Rhizomicrobium sp.]